MTRRSCTRSATGQALVEAIRGPRNRAAEPAGVDVALDGQQSTVPTLPGLHERMREQRQCAGLSLGVPDQQVDQTVLQAQTALRAGSSMASRSLSLERGDQQDALPRHPGEQSSRSGAPSGPPAA